MMHFILGTLILFFFYYHFAKNRFFSIIKFGCRYLAMLRANVTCHMLCGAPVKTSAYTCVIGCGCWGMGLGGRHARRQRQVSAVAGKAITLLG